MSGKYLLRMMKTRYSFFLLLPVVVLLMMGCPVGLDYSLGAPGTESIDKSLVGTWMCTSDEGEVKRVQLAKGKDNSYAVTVLERGELYSLETNHLTGWATTVQEKSFIYLQPMGDEKYYHYCYWMEGSTLVTCNVALLDGGIDAVSSTETLRSQVSRSMRMEDWGKETLEWIKE